MRYVDGFVLPLKKRNLPAYRRIARLAGKVWREHGATNMSNASETGRLEDGGRNAQVHFRRWHGRNPREKWCYRDHLKVQGPADRIMKKVMRPAAAEMWTRRGALRHKRMGIGWVQTIVDSDPAPPAPILEPDPVRKIMRPAVSQAAKNAQRARELTRLYTAVP